MNNKKVSIGIILIVVAAGLFLLPSAIAQFTDPDKTRATVFGYGSIRQSETNPEYNLTFNSVVVLSACTRAMSYEPQIVSIENDINLSKPNKVNQTIIDNIIRAAPSYGCDVKNGQKISGVLFTEGWK